MRLAWLTSIVLGLFAVAAGPAAADSGFTDYRQAAIDQYGAPSSSPASTSASSTGQSFAAVQPKAVKHAGSSKGRRPASGHKGAGAGSVPSSQRRSPSGSRPQVEGISRARPLTVALPSHAGTTQRGTLPFTGDALGLVALVALALLALGLLLAASLRMTRGLRRAGT